MNICILFIGREMSCYSLLGCSKVKTTVKIKAWYTKQDKVSLIGINKTFLSQGAKIYRFKMKFRALFSTPKQILCHSSKNTQPISTKFQGLLNVHERHVWVCLKTFDKFLLLCPGYHFYRFMKNRDYKLPRTWPWKWHCRSITYIGFPNLGYPIFNQTRSRKVESNG